MEFTSSETTNTWLTLTTTILIRSFNDLQRSSDLVPLFRDESKVMIIEASMDPSYLKTT
jgi:hypothetical protein